jgi:hypothetical protein
MSHAGFFIVGAPRSGTTLLQSILAGHPQLYSAPETSFFNRIIPLLGSEFHNPDAELSSDHFAKIEEDFHYMTGFELSLAGKVPGNATVRDVFEAMLQSFNKDGKDYWVEKTTNHARAMMLIRRFYPDAKFIHLIRDPVDSVGSMIRIRPTGPLDFRIRYVSPITGFARVWQKCVNGAMQYPDQDNVHHLFYEDLVADPATNVRAVCDFLGVDFSETMLSGFENETDSLLSVDHCPWQQENTRSGFHKETAGKARRELAAGDVWLIQRVVKEQASTLGYYDVSAPAPYLGRIRTLLFEFLRYCVYVSSLELPLRRLLGANRQ